MPTSLLGDNTRSSGATASRRCCRIADITVALYSDDPTLQFQADDATTSFLIEDAEPDVCLHATWGDLRHEQGGNLLFDSGGLWQLVAADDAYHFRFTSPALGALPYKVACLSRDFTRGQVTLHRPYFPDGHCISPLEYPLDELLLIHALTQGKGVEVHACGVVDIHGQGHLFLGQSGAGKTTLAELWLQQPGVTILSDDRIILRHMDNRFWMYGTPWHGEGRLAWPARAPLTQLYMIRHGGTNALVPQRSTESLGALFACSFPPFYNFGALDFTLGFLEEVTNAVPCYELYFVPYASVVEFLQQ